MGRFSVSQAKEDELLARMEKCHLREEDLQESFVRSGGPGGQKVNRTASCVQLVHTPSGLQVKMQKERSQSLNRFFARRRMCELLEEAAGSDAAPKARFIAKARKQKDRQRRRRAQHEKTIEESTETE